MRRLFALGVVLSLSPTARAGVDSTSGPCTVSGTLVENVEVYDAAQGGVQVVTLTGTARWLDVSAFAPKATRVRVRSGTQTPSLRVEGFANWSAVSIGARHNVTVMPPLLSIRSTVPLRLVESGGSLVATPRDPTFRDVTGLVTCSDLQITKQSWPPAPTPGGSERVATGKALALYAKPEGSPAITLEFADPASTVRFSAYEAQDGFVHVRLVRDVFVDGWVKASALVSSPVTMGKMYGISGNSGWGSSGSSYWAQRDTEVRLGPNSGAPLVGTLEKGARVVHWGGEANKDGWSEIRIYGSDAREPTGKSFFVRENDLWGTPP